MIDQIKYVAGDATEPIQKNEGQAYNYLLHICNNVGAWGAGFVIPLAKKWPEVKKAYHEVIRELSLGENQIVPVEENLAVVNMIAQLDVVPIVHNSKKLPNVQYDALFHCLNEIGNQAYPESRFHFPMFGAGLGGGDWQVIASLVNQTLTYRHETYCYIVDQKWMGLIK